QAEGDNGDEGDAAQADDVVEAPAPRRHIGQSEGDDGHTGAQGGGHGHQSDGIRPRPGGKLLGGDDRQEDVQPVRTSLGEHLAGREPGQRGGGGTGGREDASGGGGHEDHAPAAPAVGGGQYGEGDEAAQADQGAGHALGAVAGVEVVGREGDGLVEERV